MTEVLFIHSPSLHEAHRMLAEALYSPSGRKALGERCFAEAIEADFEPVYLLEGGMPIFTACLKKRKNYKYLFYAFNIVIVKR